MAPTVSPNSNTGSGPEQQKHQTLPKPGQRKDQLSPKRITPQTKPTAPPLPQQKKVPRRSSKPIINWFQRKLAGTVRTKRVENVSQQAADTGRGKGRTAIPTRVAGRITSSPLPSPGLSGGRQQGKLDALAAARRKTISLNGDDDRGYSPHTDDQEDVSSDRSSSWSPSSALEADEDASVRPIPPSAPPSPSPSRSSSSYLSDPRTFRSMAASTKPTTLLSIDLNGNGMAHIAQVPTPTSQINRLPPHIRTSSSATNPTLLGSGASITFSALPPSPQSSSRPSSLRNPGSINSSNPSTQQAPPNNNGPISSVQAPLHTTHHPRNNPRPSSPPLDNASVLTLASSAYAMPGLRLGVGAQGWGSAPPSAVGAGDSLSHFGGSITYADAESTSQFVLGDDERLEERDVDASVRALRPRSSRRGSWESEASRWSARVQLGAGTSLVRERSLWTTNSIRTGGFSADNVETYERSDIGNGNEDLSPSEVQALHSDNLSTPDHLDVDAARLMSPSVVSDSEVTPKNVVVAEPHVPSVSPIGQRQLSADTVSQLAPKDEESESQTEEAVHQGQDETKKDRHSARLEGEKENGEAKTPQGQLEAEVISSAVSPTENDVWHSAPSTPMLYSGSH